MRQLKIYGNNLETKTTNMKNEKITTILKAVINFITLVCIVILISRIIDLNKQLESEIEFRYVFARSERKQSMRADSLQRELYRFYPTTNRISKNFNN